MANGNELVCVELYGHGHRYGQDASDMISEEMANVVKASSSQQQRGSDYQVQIWRLWIGL